MAFVRFQRRGGDDAKQQQRQSTKPRAQAPTERVGEILSDSNSEFSSLDGDNDGDEHNSKAKSTQATHRNAASTRSSRNASSVSSSNGPDTAVAASNGARRTRETSGGGAKIQQLPTKASPGATAKNPTSSRRQNQARAAKGLKKTGSRKWYSDSENDDDIDVVAAARVSVKTDSHKSHQENEQGQEEDVHAMEDDDSDLEQFISGSMGERRNNVTQDEPAEKNSNKRSLGEKKLKSLRDQVESPTSEPPLKTSAKPQGVLSPQSDASDAPSFRGLDPGAKKKTGLQKLVAKTFSPFSSRRKSIETPAMDVDNALNKKKSVVASTLSDASTSSVAGGGSDRKQSMDVVGASQNPRQDSFPSSNEQSQMEQSAVFNSRKPRSTVGDMISSQNEKSRSSSINASSAPEPSGQLVNRRMSRLKQSSNGPEFGSAPRSLDSTQEILVRRALENATATSGGTATTGGSEALSPGQRKLAGAFAGHPGSSVVLEGWLRQKQRRGMKGMKKWNTRYFVLYAKTNEVRYYADVVQSAWGPIPLGEIGSISLRLIQRIGKPSHPKYRGCRFDITCRNSWGTHYADDYVSSDEENNNSNSVNNNEEAKQERSSTPRSSRVYSLMADSPQTTVTWVNTLDSLLRQ
uniref:PH domain-containing protein n=1 Tax=Globisporangium ultimum (strain ATCC 200006 / CBS 805.95 / DAOM BR144) TaxID=431595 RepID=K3WY78_GLOUD